ncbi:MAG TPA: potassium channel family protein [Aggregatilineales bacterium]|nr:potassium channel family protein [Aggregatilineales bacterium]
MTPFDYNRRQLRIALLALCIIIPIGVIGYILIEKLNVLDALWITIVTLSTIGYGDVVPRTDLGRLFTLFIIVFGLGAVGIGAQAFIEVLVSPNIRMIRQRRRAEKRIQTMRRHFIICGEGEVLIVITPMQYADLLRELAHGQADKRPRTLRFQTLPV